MKIKMAPSFLKTILKKESLAGNSSILVLINVAISVVSLITVPLVLRVFSFSQFGEIMLALSLASFFTLVLIPQTWQLVANNSFGCCDTDVLARQAIGLKIDFTCFGVYVLSWPIYRYIFECFFSWSFNSVALFALFIASGSTGLSAVYGRLRLEGHVYKLGMLNSIAPIFRFLAAIAIVYKGDLITPVPAVLALYVAPEAARFLLNMKWALTGITTTRLLGVRVSWEEIRFFSQQNLGRIFRSPFETVDRLVVGFFFGEAVAGIYSIGRRLGAVTSLIIEPITQLSFGKFSQEGQKRAQIQVLQTFLIIALLSVLSQVLLIAALELELTKKLLLGQKNYPMTALQAKFFFSGLLLSLCVAWNYFLTAHLNQLRYEAKSTALDMLGLAAAVLAVVLVRDESLMWVFGTILLFQIFAKVSILIILK